MQIISKHWTDENVKSPAKSVNSPLIKKFTGVDHYKARADQLEIVMGCITKDNYTDMRQRVKHLDDNDINSGSSNFGKLMDWLESNDDKWIKQINGSLD
ncbi:MAG: hypothetical protein LUF92_04685 [Clostridiales bacterium]|nr:hypothetical protein [Clostridiales bacterium]